MSEFTDKAQDVVGDLTGDSSLQAEGKVDQVTAKAKQAAGQLGDAAQNAQDAAQNAAQDAAGNVVEAAKKSRGVVNALHRVGVRSEWAYAAGFASIGLALGSWFLSRSKTGDSKGQSDR